MKRILIALLALAMVLSMAFALASCNDDKKENDTKETEKPAEKEPAAIPEGYVLYDNGKITFAYPEKWTKTAGSVDIITNESGTGNNITVSYEQYSDTYKKMTVEDFKTMLKPYLEEILPLVPDTSEYYDRAQEILGKIADFSPIDKRYLSEDSLYHEFV